MCYSQVGTIRLDSIQPEDTILGQGACLMSVTAIIDSKKSWAVNLSHIALGH